MAEYQDIVHVVEVDRGITATGDGRSRLFPLMGDDHRLMPTVVNAVFVSDWQGQLTQLYAIPRTNVIPYAWNIDANWSDLFGNDIARPAPAEVTPDGRSGRVSSIRLGDCTAGVAGVQGGVYVDSPDALTPDVKYLFSVWLRASTPLVVNLSADASGPTEAGGQFTVGTDWVRVYIASDLIQEGETRAGGIMLSKNLNPGVSDDAQLFMVYGQTEINGVWLNGVPGRFIPTNGAAATVQDFRLSESNILTTDPVANTAPIYWTGTGYWLESPSGYTIAPMDVLAAVTWRFDESTNLLALLRAKQRWYTANHTRFWVDWTESIFKLSNANTFGVAIWAFILNVPLSVLSLRDDNRYWAFGPTRGNFTESEGPVNPTSGNFPPVSQNGSIGTPREKIQALRLKYYALTTDATIVSLNKMLADVFEDDGLAYVVDNEDMTMEYVFTFPVSTGFRQSMLEYGLLPKPAGVNITITAP